MEIINRIKYMFPGIADRAMEEILRAALNKHMDARTLHELEKTHAGAQHKARENYARSCAYLCGLIKAYHDAGWIPEFRNPHETVNTLPGDMRNIEYYHAFDPEEAFQEFSVLVNQWLCGEM